MTKVLLINPPGTGLRKRSLWPPFEIANVQGRKWFSPLRNWRGLYPCKQIRLFKRDDRIPYQSKGNHCRLSFKNWGRLVNYSPEITMNYDIGFFHYHFAFRAKNGENRADQRNSKVNLIDFTRSPPNEINLYDLE